MFKLLKEKFSDKTGANYIWICVLIIVICILLVFATYYIAGISHIRVQEQEAQTVLDSYVADNAVKIYSALKNGKNIDAVLDEDEFLDELIDFSMLTPETINGVEYYVYYTDEDKEVWSYYISAPQLSYAESDPDADSETTEEEINDTSDRIDIAYTIYIPIRLSNGDDTISMVVSTEITLSSYLTLSER